MQIEITVDGLPHKKVGEALTELVTTEVQAHNYWSKRGSELLNVDLSKGNINLQDLLDEVTSIYIIKAAIICDNKQQIAKTLGLGSYQTVTNKTKKLGINLSEYGL